MAAPLLEVRGLAKHFPGVQALDGVSLTLQRGEILAIIGENGAGKSTLMKCLAGIYKPDAGQVLLDGAAIQLGSIRDALKHGISLIHQELNLAENLSVAANLYLGREIMAGGPVGFLASRAMRAGALKLMERVGLTCSPDELVDQLAPGQRQLVEIARALSLQVRILIMDEPTSSLTQRETEKLFAVMRDLQRQGVAVVYISHRLAEVVATADRVVVLRDGKYAGQLWKAAAAPRPEEAISHETMVRLMVGRDLKQYFHKQHGPQTGKPPRLEVSEVRYAGGPAAPVSFNVLPGEILGVAGLMGAGRTELVEALFGIRPIVAGEVRIDGQAVAIRRPRDAIAAGLVLAPEDRRQHGLVLDDSIEHNIGLPSLRRLSLAGFLRRRRERRLAEAMSAKLHVRAPSIRQFCSVLSGGNQQKVVVGKWLAREPHVLIFDEPTRGIDVGAKSEIYALMDSLAGQGVAIVMVSSDLEEILGMSDRVLVLHQGRLAGTLGRRELSEEAIMRLATGG